jgi:hypothetical protein
VNTGIFHETENCEVDVAFYLGKYCVMYSLSHKGYISGFYCKHQCFLKRNLLVCNLHDMGLKYASLQAPS